MIVFVDLEASSLDADGWPVEVGLSWLRDGRARTVSSLIRPEPDWPMTAWSAESAAVHRIPLREPRDAPAAAEVARWAAEVIGGDTLVSDAPEFDGRWLHRLLAAAEGLRVPPVIDFDRLVATHCDLDRTRRVYAHLDRAPTPHRAGPDAERLARAWAAGMGDGR